MSLTILSRPEGYILNETENAGLAIESGIPGKVAINTGSSHGLTTGDIVYISSNIDDYNGFFSVDVSAANQFRIISLSSGERIDYVQDSDNVLWQVSSTTHGFSCVHLPIVYKISNNIYPLNSVDAIQTITSLTSYAGFAQIGLSGSLGTFEDLSFVKISGAPDPTLDGIYQIIDKLSTSSVILNVSQGVDSPTFTNANIIGASIQLFYGSYTVSVRVYAGINASHEWAAEKPYELAQTLNLIPDENNEVIFSMNEILKAYIETRNETTLGTLPNNIDFWTNFYISIAESYDTSNGYTITNTESSFTSDQSTFEGTAVNAMLEFKNIHSGYLSEYLMTNATAKFLTLFAIPVLFQCGDNAPSCYQDISFINPYNDFQCTLRKEYYSNDTLSLISDNDLDEADQGVMRHELSANCDYDRVDLKLLVKTASFSQTNILTSVGVTQIQNYDVFILAGELLTGILQYAANITLNPTVSAGDVGQWSLLYIHDDGSTTSIASASRTTLGTTITPITDFPTPTKNVIQIRSTTSIADAPPTTLNASVALSVNLLMNTESQISETKQFYIECGCTDQEIIITWLNNLGGFDYWKFTGQTQHAIDVTQATETKKNIFPNWPKSYGNFADTIRKQTARTSMVKKFITSQHLTIDQADAIAFIKSSPLVQIINSRTDRRTVIVDTDSFVKYEDNDKLITIGFNIIYTDDIPSQRV